MRKPARLTLTCFAVSAVLALFLTSCGEDDVGAPVLPPSILTRAGVTGASALTIAPGSAYAKSIYSELFAVTADGQVAQVPILDQYGLPLNEYEFLRREAAVKGSG